MKHEICDILLKSNDNSGFNYWYDPISIQCFILKSTIYNQKYGSRLFQSIF